MSDSKKKEILQQTFQQHLPNNVSPNIHTITVTVQHKTVEWKLLI